MAAWAPPPDPPTHPHQTIFLREKVYQMGPKLEVDFVYTNLFFWPLAHPPPLISDIRHEAVACSPISTSKDKKG